MVKLMRKYMLDSHLALKTLSFLTKFSGWKRLYMGWSKPLELGMTPLKGFCWTKGSSQDPLLPLFPHMLFVVIYSCVKFMCMILFFVVLTMLVAWSSGEWCSRNNKCIWWLNLSSFSDCKYLKRQMEFSYLRRNIWENAWRSSKCKIPKWRAIKLQCPWMVS